MVPIGLSGYYRSLLLEILPATRPTPGVITLKTAIFIFKTCFEFCHWYCSFFHVHQCCFCDRRWFCCRFTFLFWHNHLSVYAHCGFYTDLRYVFPKGCWFISSHSDNHIYQQIHIKGLRTALVHDVSVPRSHLGVLKVVYSL